MSFLVLEDVCKRHGAVTALDRVSLTVPAGSRTAIVGPSGSGKTSLLRVVAGFDAPDAGRVTLGGTLLAGDGCMVPAYRRRVGLVAQDGALFPHLSVGDNIGFGLERGMSDRTARIAGLLRLVGLDPAMQRRRPDELSGGQQQRVALARAMALQPRLMLLDEPFSALDTGLRVSTRRAVAELLTGAGITTVLVTHDQTEALSFADHVAVMREGRLVQAGPPRLLYAHPADPAVARFLGEAIILPAQIGGGIAACALGRVAVPEGAAPGGGQIMLRPEQVTLLPADRGAAAGRVVDVEFAGAVCRCGVLVGETMLSLRQAGDFAFAPGAGVQFAISGTAHVFSTGSLMTGDATIAGHDQGG